MILKPTDERRRIAAAHFLTLEDPKASEDDVLAAIAWIEESADHYELIQEVSRFSGLCDVLSPDDVRSASPFHNVRTAIGAWGGFSAIRWSIAAAVAFAVISLAFLIAHTNILTSRGQADTVEYFTDVGESKTVTLPDRTRVTLGGASGIRVDYRSSLRRIVLTSGEAFFDVVRDKARPLVVETVDGEITALGTEFNVHRSLHATTVTLISGRVKAETIQREDGPVAILRPNTQVEISVSGGLSPVREVDGAAALAWKRGSYRYDDTPLGMIVSDLQRYYNRSIVLASPSLNDMRFTGVVTLTADDIEQWLLSLQYLGQINVTVRPDTIIISDSTNFSSQSENSVS